MSSERNEASPDVPSTEENVGVPWEIGAGRGIVGPEDLPEDFAQTLINALEAVYNSKDSGSSPKNNIRLGWSKLSISTGVAES